MIVAKNNGVFLKTKDEVFDYFKQYHIMVEQQTRKKLKCYDLTMEENICLMHSMIIAQNKES